MTSMKYLRRLHPAKARSSHDVIAQTIGKEILTGLYPPGANLPPEAALMARFKVSRTVLREVMKTLSAKGLVVLKTRVGTRVLNSSSWNFFDAELLAWRVEIGFDENFRNALREIRLAVEPAAAALAATRRSAEEVERMRSCVAHMADPCEGRAGFAEADLEFHLTIGAASGNPMMRSLAAVIETALLASFTQNTPVFDAADLAATSRAHGAIVDAIEAGDAGGARKAMIAVIELGEARQELRRMREPGAKKK
jgi:DNA-binding FadR family transcriptional regulator